jgi:hypothetical protein
MKKYVLLLCLLAVAHFGFAGSFPLTDPVLPKDSVVVEFGKSGKIVIYVETKEDFEKLKLMDINEIIRELDLEKNVKDDEMIIVQRTRKDGTVQDIVTVRDNWDATDWKTETEVKVGKLKVLVDQSGLDTKVKLEKGEKKKDDNFRTYFETDLGINNYLQNGSFPTSDAPYAAKGWGSWNIGLNWMAAHKISKGFFWKYGLGFHFYNFKFENRDYQAVRTPENIGFQMRSDVDGFKSKISASYVTAMTLFELDFGKMKNEWNKGLKLAFGPYAGYRLGGRSKFVYRELDGSGRKKDKEDTGLYLNNFRYGLRGELGIGDLKFFSSYDLNTLFQEGKGPELNPLTFGIVLHY